MPHVFRRWVQLLSVLLLMLALPVPVVAQAAQTPGYVTGLDRIVRDRVATVTQWESAARVQIILTLAAILFGGVVTAIQPLGSKRWCKAITATLGLAVAVITGVTSKAFPVDYRLYQKSALQARARLNNLRDILNRLQAGPAPEDERELYKEFIQKLKEIEAIEGRLTGESIEPGAAGMFILSAVHAQSNKPLWVDKLPDASTFVFFAGRADSRSLSDAKTKSMDDALRQSAAYLQKQSKSSEFQAAKDLARALGEVVDTSFTFERQSQTYTYYTLLRLTRNVAQPWSLRALMRPLSAVRLQLASIQVNEDGSVGSTKWAFQIARNGAVVARIPLRPYNDKTEKVVSGDTVKWSLVDLPVGEDATLMIEGSSAGGRTISGTITVPAADLTPDRSVRVPVMDATNRRLGWFVFSFQFVR